MDDSIKRYKQRRDERLKKRMDDDWITMRGTHVLIDDEGQVSKGPSNLKSVVEKSGGYKKKGSVADLRKPNLGNVNKKPDNPSAGKYIDTLEKGGMRDRTVERTKGKVAPVPADLSAEGMKRGYKKAIDEGLDADDVLTHYMRGHDIGAKVTVDGMEYEKVGDGKWKPKDKWGARWESGFEKDRDMAGRIASAYLTGGKVEVKKGNGSVESQTPRPKTKLETMKNNKERYAKVQEEIKGMKPGLERDVKEKVILPWIKGDNWMGGMPDRKFEQIAKKMPYGVNEIYDEFQKQMMKY